jgi:hypothetical protein
MGTGGTRQAHTNTGEHSLLELCSPFVELEGTENTVGIITA